MGDTAIMASIGLNTSHDSPSKTSDVNLYSVCTSVAIVTSAIV